MKLSDRAERVMKVLLLVTCGAVLPGGSCMSDVRDNLVKGGLGFVNSFTQQAVDALIPDVNELFPAVPPKW